MKKLSGVINAKDTKSHINPEIYGHFSEHLGRCIYKGIYVGEDSPIPNTDGIRNDVIEAFRQIKVPVMRWPGGCFADTYHWKDGVGQKQNRKKIMNIHWGGTIEDNSFGTHEFFRFCELIGCEPYIAGNLGSGTVEELSEWIEYMTSDDLSPMADMRRANGQEKAWKLRYLGIGNENWGCGGNMRPEYYCDLYRRYQTFCRDYSGNHLYKVACGPNAYDYNWTEVCMKNIPSSQVNAISLHYYTVPYGNWAHKGSATDFTEAEYYETIHATLDMETLLTRHGEIMNRYDPEKNIGLIVDEWGCWFDVEEGTNPGFLYQQNTMRDAIIACINLNLFNKHSDRVVMANLAQAVNVLQALILTEGEKMIKTPTYHIFDMWKNHQGGELVYSYTENEEINGVPAVSQSVSVKDGQMTITISNCSLSEDYEIDFDICGYKPSSAKASILTGEVHAHNTFEAPENVKTAEYNVEITENGVKAVIPACSAVSICLK